jgi:hypothetical protein
MFYEVIFHPTQIELKSISPTDFYFYPYALFNITHQKHIINQYRKIDYDLSFLNQSISLWFSKKGNSVIYWLNPTDEVLWKLKN